MGALFFERLKKYYSDIGDELLNRSKCANIFPNPTDKGTNREEIYLNFLKDHIPLGCNIFLGGFLFNKKGDESKQIDIIITCDTAPQYNFLISDGIKKSFTCIEGTVAIVSVKSKLTSNELVNCLDNFASIPEKEPLGEKGPFIYIADYDDWPFKIIFAYDCDNYSSISSTLKKYYEKNSEIPLNKRPNFIHVLRQGYTLRTPHGGMKDKNGELIEASLRDGEKLPPNTFYSCQTSDDAWALAFVQFGIQMKCLSSRALMFKYAELLDQL